MNAHARLLIEIAKAVQALLPDYNSALDSATTAAIEAEDKTDEQNDSKDPGAENANGDDSGDAS